MTHYIFTPEELKARDTQVARNAISSAYRAIADLLMEERGGQALAAQFYKSATPIVQPAAPTVHAPFADPDVCAHPNLTGRNEYKTCGLCKKRVYFADPWSDR